MLLQSRNSTPYASPAAGEGASARSLKLGYPEGFITMKARCPACFIVPSFQLITTENT
jgi:hypothetical protein